MDYDKLIERLHKEAYGSDIEDLLLDATTAIETLRTENVKLQYEAERQRRSADDMRHLCENAERAYTKAQADLARVTAERDAAIDRVKRALAMMWFAYVNSDKEFPHTYETEALEEAERILGPWAECMPKYLRRKEG